jgi:hypothetical protein
MSQPIAVKLLLLRCDKFSIQSALRVDILMSTI